VLADPTFNGGGLNTRRVTGRNTPSAINAIFNVRNFWHGRANNMFNGGNPFGAPDANARGLVPDDLGERARLAGVLTSASHASQAVGAQTNTAEVPAGGGGWFKVGNKKAGVSPPDGQEVKNAQRALGAMAVAGGKGLAPTSADMIRPAFQPKWWNSAQVVD